MSRTDRHPRLLRTLFVMVAALALPVGAAACSDDTEKDVKKAAESVREDAEDAAGTAAARAAAEDLRVRVKVNDAADTEGLRSVAALQESADDVAGDPKITGIEDGDGDGLDDDGKVQVTVSDQSACLTLPAEGDDTTVESGEC